MRSLCWLEQSQEKNECCVLVFEVGGSFFFVRPMRLLGRCLLNAFFVKWARLAALGCSTR